MAAADEHAHGRLRQVLASLAESGVVPAAAAALDAGMAEAVAALGAAVLAEVPAFSESANPEVLPQLRQHALAHVQEMRRLLGGGALRDFAFVRAHAQLRAEQRLPLEATLHAYRCGHRILARWVRDAAVAAGPAQLEQAVAASADFAIEYTNTISTIATSDYVAQTRLLAEAAGDLRTELLSLLLSGYDESDGRVARLLRRAGYLDQRQAYAVVVAQPANPAEMENPARAQRLVSALAEALAGAPIRVLAGIRHNLAIAVLSAARRQSGWTQAQAGLAERAGPLLALLGPAIRIGLSGDHPSTSFLPKALQEATMALDFASATERVVRFAELPVRALLVHRGADTLRQAPPGWLAALVAADAKAAGALTQTLRALADADLNIQAAARGLGKHPNTVYARLLRIKELTGLDGQRYHGLTELLLAADCCRR